MRYNIDIAKNDGYVAQLVEHWTFNPQVLGSNPNVPKIYEYIHGNFKFKLYFKHCNNFVFHWSTRTCFKQKKHINNANVY